MARRDETVRRQIADAELQLLSGVLAGIEDGITVQEPGGELVFANASAARLVGLPSPEVMLATPVREVFARFEVFAKDGTPFPFERLPGRAVLAGAPGESVVLRHRVAGTNDDRWSHVRAYPVLGADGELASVINVFRDVTEEHRIAVENARLVRELEETVARERKAREQAERAARFSEIFIGIVGHDLRNPVGAIALGAEIVLGASTDERLRRIATRIATSAQRMTRMIEQLLDLTRIRLGEGLSVQPTSMNLEVLARQIADETEAAHGCSIEVTVLGDPDGAWDADGLGQALSNLLANAAVHGTKGHMVLVRIDGSASPTLLLTVRNDGEIPADLLPTIFEPFHGSLEARRAARGLGLGLYITREIVHAHGGRIAVACDEGGTAFRIELPRAPSAARRD